jgi:RND family efflux transporter MFP subunit
MRFAVKHRTRMVIIVLMLMAAGSVIVYRKFPRGRIEPVTVVETSLGAIDQIITATGSVEAKRTVLVTAETSAKIAALYFEEQDIVKKGQVLAKLDDVELATQLRQMESALKLAETTLSGAKATLQQTTALYEKGYVARQEVEAAQRQVDTSNTQVEEKKSSIQLLKAKLSRTLIRAPIGGAITRKLVEVGGIVSDGSRSAASSAGGQFQPMAIAEIAHLEALEFHVDVDQTDIGMIKRGQRVLIMLDAFPDRRFSGAVEEVTLSSVEETGGRVRYKVRVGMQKTDAPLRLGMTGNVDFLLARKENIVTLPASVLIQRGGEDFVFVVKDGKAHLTPIHTGLRNEEIVEVVTGLPVGSQVIDQGRGRVKDRQAVEVLNGRR